MKKYSDAPYMYRSELSKKIEELLDKGADVCVDGLIKFNGKYIRPKNDPLPPGSKIAIPPLSFPRFDVSIDGDRFELEAYYKHILLFPVPVATLITTYGETKEEAEKKWWEIAKKYDLIPKLNWDKFQ